VRLNRIAYKSNQTTTPATSEPVRDTSEADLAS
jgi:hypothetical protein